MFRIVKSIVIFLVPLLLTFAGDGLRAGQNPPANNPTPEEVTWREAVKTVWDELMTARRQPDLPEAARTETRAIPKIQADLDKLVAEGIRNGHQCRVVEYVPLKNPTVPAFSKNLKIQGVVPDGMSDDPVVLKVLSKYARARGNLTAGNPVLFVHPALPTRARRDAISGTVKVEIVISKTGRVLAAKYLGGDPIFRACSLIAVGQSRFQPFLLDGKPVNVATVVAFTFRIPY